MFNIPNEEENKKLKNILKLRETVEKDLEKKGISVQKKEQKQNTIYKPSSDLETINVNIESIKTWFDIIMSDISETDEKVAVFLENRLSSKTPNVFSNQYGLMHLLRNDFMKAEKFFLINQSCESLFNYGVLKIFRKDQDVLDYSKSLMNKYPQSGYPYLLISMFFTFSSKYDAAIKSLSAANKYLGYAFLDMAISLYYKKITEASSYLSKSFLENRAKGIVSLLQFHTSVFTEDYDKKLTIGKKYEKEETGCAKCLTYLVNKKPEETPMYCRYQKRLLAMNQEENGIFIPENERLDYDFIKFFNMKFEQNANSAFQKIVDTFGNLRIFLTADSIAQKGLKTGTFYLPKDSYSILLKGPDYCTELRNTLAGLKQNYNKEFDFIIDIPFYEVLRIIFGWRTCQKING